MVNIRRLDQDDPKHIADWLRARELSAEGSINLPELGLIAYKTGCPIAAGFLRRVEGGYAILDSLVTNPMVLPALRDKTLDLLVKDLISLAKENGIKGLIATTVDCHVIERALKHGFIKLPHVSISLAL